MNKYQKDKEKVTEYFNKVFRGNTILLSNIVKKLKTVTSAGVCNVVTVEMDDVYFFPVSLKNGNPDMVFEKYLNDLVFEPEVEPDLDRGNDILDYVDIRGNLGI